MGDGDLAAGLLPPFEEGEFSGLNRMIEKVEASLGEEGIELQVRHTLLGRVNDGDAVTGKRLDHAVGGVVIGVDGGYVVRMHGPGNLSDDPFQVDGATTGLPPALEEVLDDVGVAIDDLVVDNRGGEGVLACTGGIDSTGVD